jgi:glyoxylase-like metal-dependent hydrolase (beta-lactamase superfamily II)
VLIDLFFQGRAQVIGSYLLLGDPPALVETGPASCLDALEAGLDEAGLEIADLGALIVTHIHLDHAGACGVLVRRNRDLGVYVHRVGAPHLVDPSRLVRSAQRIYGNKMDRLWGEVAPVPADRVTALDDAALVEIAGRRLRALDTPGHANHHNVYWDEGSGAVYTGDTTGVALPGCAYVRPPTPPPELDLEAWERTLDRIDALAARRLCLTHFGVREDPAEVLSQMRHRLREFADVLRPGWERGEGLESLIARMREHAKPQVETMCGSEIAERHEIASNYRMNVQGFVRYFERQRAGLEIGYQGSTDRI